MSATLSFKRSELLYDIKNYAYVESHIMPDDTEHAKHMTADVGDDGNIDRITRVLDLGVAACTELLYPLAKSEVTADTLDDTLQETATYTITLSLPDTFSQSTLTLLERLIHEFLVCRGVADWLSITNTQKAEVWAAKADEAETAIRSSVNTRSGRSRIRQHWLG